MSGIKFCPKCESENVEMMVSGYIGMWQCRKCGFSGSIFPEKEKLEEETNDK